MQCLPIQNRSTDVGLMDARELLPYSLRSHLLRPQHGTGGLSFGVEFETRGGSLPKYGPKQRRVETILLGCT